MSADKFAPRSPADTSRLVRGHPLAWVVSVATGEPRATLLPMLPVEVDGRLERLMGHFARSNPQVQLLQAQPRALIRATRAKFKLGQDERDDVFSDIVRGLESQGASELLAWMLAFNQQRAGGH